VASSYEIRRDERRRAARASKPKPDREVRIDRRHQLSIYEGRYEQASDADEDAEWVSLGELDTTTGRWLKPPHLWKPFGRRL
jgi:hypothetical protein